MAHPKIEAGQGHLGVWPGPTVVVGKPFTKGELRLSLRKSKIRRVTRYAAGSPASRYILNGSHRLHEIVAGTPAALQDYL